MSKTLNTRLDDSLVDEVQRLAIEQRISISELVRRALVAHLGCDQNQLLYEIVKTRAVLLHAVDSLVGKETRTAIIEEAEADAREYVKEQTHDPL